MTQPFIPVPDETPESHPKPARMGGAGLVFRGSGFYITDYGKDGKGPRKAEEMPAAEKPAEKKSETSAGKETKQAEPAAKKAKPE